MPYGDDIIQGGIPSFFNPNTITDTSTQGPGSGNGVQSAQQKQQYGSQIDWGQDPLGILQSAFPETPIDVLSKYAWAISPIDQSLYQLSDPNSLIYQQMFGEYSEFLGDEYRGRRQRGMGENIGMSEKRFGGMGKRGFRSGRDWQGQQSRATSEYGQQIGQQFGKGLYDIKSDIIDRAQRNKEYMTRLEDNRRMSLLRLAELGEFIDTDYNESGNFIEGMSGWSESQDGTWEYNPDWIG